MSKLPYTTRFLHLLPRHRLHRRGVSRARLGLSAHTERPLGERLFLRRVNPLLLASLSLSVRSLQPTWLHHRVYLA